MGERRSGVLITEILAGALLVVAAGMAVYLVTVLRIENHQLRDENLRLIDKMVRAQADLLYFKQLQQDFLQRPIVTKIDEQQLNNLAEAVGRYIASMIPSKTMVN